MNLDYGCLVSPDLLAILSVSSLLGAAVGFELESAGLLIEDFGGSLIDVELPGGVDEEDETGGVIASVLEASFEFGD